MKSPGSLIAIVVLLVFAIWLTIFVHRMPPDAAATRNSPLPHAATSPSKPACPVTLTASSIVPASSAPISNVPVIAGPHGKALRHRTPVGLSPNGISSAGGMDVQTTVTNNSGMQIDSLSFLADHTDSYGVTSEPNQSTLNVDRIIKVGESVPLHWQIPMDTPSVAHGKAAASSDLQVYQIKFGDGRIESVSELDDACYFSF